MVWGNAAPLNHSKFFWRYWIRDFPTTIEVPVCTPSTRWCLGVKADFVHSRDSHRHCGPIGTPGESPVLLVYLEGVRPQMPHVKQLPRFPGYFLLPNQQQSICSHSLSSDGSKPSSMLKQRGPSWREGNLFVFLCLVFGYILLINNWGIRASQ